MATSTNFHIIKWMLENLFTEVFFGIFLIPLVIWGTRALYERFIKAQKIIYILKLHNNPTRTWRKGVYATDRFMDIYESKSSLYSDQTLMHGGGDAGAVWRDEYLDRGILEKHGLVSIFEEEGRKKVKIKDSRLTKTVYKILKNKEEKEKILSEQYRSNNNGYRD